MTTAAVGEPAIRRARNTQLAFVLLVLIAITGVTQVRVVSAPPEPSLLNITRQWSRESSLGDLREIRAAPGYLELRVWRGYALTGTTQAVVVRRTEGHWSTFLARVLRCEIQVPRVVWDTAVRATVQRYIADARRHCGTTVIDASAGDRILATDSLVVDTLGASQATIQDAWTAAVRAGALQLPPGVARARVLDDPLMYVVELRSGNEYRASAIENLEPPETVADRQVQDVYAAVTRLLNIGERLKP